MPRIWRGGDKECEAFGFEHVPHYLPCAMGADPAT
jgi:hypothetical protein